MPDCLALVEMLGDEIHNDAEELVIPLASDFTLVMRSGHAETPRTQTGEVDWAGVFRVQVTEIKVSSHVI